MNCKFYVYFQAEIINDSQNGPRVSRLVPELRQTNSRRAPRELPIEFNIEVPDEYFLDRSMPTVSVSLQKPASPKPEARVGSAWEEELIKAGAHGDL